jgi:glycosyltransferase involved in cell wall biosynthesis
MRILQVNRYFWPCAGPERYMLELAALLERQGHSLCFFAMQHRRNLSSECSRFFVSPIEYAGTSGWYKLRTAPRAIGKTLYSWESKRKLRALLAEKRPHLAHLHGISRHISPSILHVLGRLQVPTVQTVHNAEFICPAKHLFIEHRQEICERCLGGGYHHAVLNRCVQNSRAASLLAAAAQYVHRRSRIFENNVDLFIAPSRFLAGKLAAGGIPAGKIRHLPNYLDLDSYAADGQIGRYGLFLGRLSPEKGLTTLLEAAGMAREVSLVIAGEGPLRGALEERIQRQSLHHVTLAGHRQGAQLHDLIRGAAFVVLPSECYENSPMAIYEAGALARPVVASDIGGVPELVCHGDNGLLFPPGNAEQLADSMRRLHADPPRCREMGRRNREHLEIVCRDHYPRLMALYEEASR